MKAFIIKEARTLCLTAALGVIGLGVLIVALTRSNSPEQQLPQVLLSEVDRTDGIFRIVGQAEPFNGWVIENYAEGQLKSRARVENGVLHGLSEGWFENGMRQVQEPFANGVSHGCRVKWYASGALKSEEEIVEGRLEGSFLEWHENGQLAKQIPLIEGVAHGVSRAWFPSGYLKARVTLERGDVREQRFFSDGEVKESAGDGVPLRARVSQSSALAQSRPTTVVSQRANS